MPDEPRYVFLEDLDGTYYVLDIREGAVVASGLVSRRDAILKVGQLLLAALPTGLGDITGHAREQRL